jgi:hypothetical protein
LRNLKTECGSRNNEEGVRGGEGPCKTGGMHGRALRVCPEGTRFPWLKHHGGKGGLLPAGDNGVEEAAMTLILNRVRGAASELGSKNV